MKVIVIYDDTSVKTQIIDDVIGSKKFSEIIIHKKTLEKHYRSSVSKVFTDVEWIKISSSSEVLVLEKELGKYHNKATRVLYCFSNYFIFDEQKALMSFEKLNYVDDIYYVLSNDSVAAIMFPDISSYLSFCQKIHTDRKLVNKSADISNSFEINGLVDVNDVNNLISCITGSFDSRYFNTLHGDDYTIEKSSTNKKKIKAEYSFYHLLPEEMKFWFVMPFKYCEDEKSASYKMERLHMTDLAIKWICGSIDEAEFEKIIDKYLFFLSSRKTKNVTKQEYDSIAKTLYEDKVRSRIEALKGLEAYKKIKRILDSLQENMLDVLVNKYFELKEKVEAKNNYPCISVIGHGDLCFSNSLYNKPTRTLKFIDPKGAISEEDLWTNPYYDVAKLSHSICGNYDFFNNSLFDIKLCDDFKYKLEIPFDNSKYVQIFKRKIEENGFSYLAVRLYEASLFISMLPLHIDNPYKVLGFILNANNILEEIKKDV